MRALIVEDGYQRGALTAVRALCRRGWKVGVASPVKGHASRSRKCGRWHRAVQPSAGIAEFVRDISSALRSGYEIVMPAGDAELLALSAARHTLGPAVALPDHESVTNVLDKGVWERVAADLGIDVPARVDGNPTFPVIVKEVLHGNATGGHTHSEAVVAADATELDKAIGEVIARGGSALVQEHIEGRLTGVILMLDRDGNVVGRCQQEAVRLWPPDAGVSAFARTVIPDPELFESLARLLRELRWWGPMEAQFLTTKERNVLIDLNPRIYGSIALATAAGLDVAWTWARICANESPQPVDAAAGHTYQWLEGDLRRAFVAPRDGRWRDVGKTVASSIGAHHSLWSISDPWPATRFAATLTRRAIGGRAWS